MYIGFTMMCVFFFYFVLWEKQTKNWGKPGIFTQNRFSKKLNLVFSVILKYMTLDTWNFQYTIKFSKYFDLFWAVYGHFQFSILDSEPSTEFIDFTMIYVFVNYHQKPILVFGVSHLKQMTVTWIFDWMFILAISKHHNILKIFWCFEL